jgi:hypothetical protein
MTKRRRTDNTMAKRRTDNTMTKRRRTDNTMTKRRRTNNTIAKRRRTDNTIAKRKEKGQFTKHSTENQRLKTKNATKNRGEPRCSGRVSSSCSTSHCDYEIKCYNSPLHHPHTYSRTR